MTTRNMISACSILGLLAILSTSAGGATLRQPHPAWPPEWWENPLNSYAYGFFGFAFSGEGHPYDSELFWSVNDGVEVDLSVVPDVGHVWDWDYRFELDAVYDIAFTAMLYIEWTGYHSPGGVLIQSLEAPYYTDWTPLTYQYEQYDPTYDRTARTYSVEPSPMEITPFLGARGDGSRPDTVWVGLVVLRHESEDLIHNDPPPPRPAGGRAATQAADDPRASRRTTSWGELKERYTD